MINENRGMSLPAIFNIKVCAVRIAFSDSFVYVSASNIFKYLCLKLSLKAVISALADFCSIKSNRWF